MHVYRLGLAIFILTSMRVLYTYIKLQWVVVAFVVVFPSAQSLYQAGKKWCQSECSVGKGLSKLLISIGKMTDLENSEPALYEITVMY